MRGCENKLNGAVLVQARVGENRVVEVVVIAVAWPVICIEYPVRLPGGHKVAVSAKVVGDSDAESVSSKRRRHRLVVDVGLPVVYDNH